MRVIVIFRAVDGPEEEEHGEDGDDEDNDEDSVMSSVKTYIWSTITFEYKNERHSAGLENMGINKDYYVDTRRLRKRPKNILTRAKSG